MYFSREFYANLYQFPIPGEDVVTVVMGILRVAGSARHVLYPSLVMGSNSRGRGEVSSTKDLAHISYMIFFLVVTVRLRVGSFLHLGVERMQVTFSSKASY